MMEQCGGIGTVILMARCHSTLKDPHQLESGRALPCVVVGQASLNASLSRLSAVPA